MSDHLVSMKKPNETAKLVISRKGEEYEVQTALLRPLEPRVPFSEYISRPSYFIYGGLVFVPLTMQYLHEYEKHYNTCPHSLYVRASEFLRKAGQQIVILSQVLIPNSNIYKVFAPSQVIKVNGVEVDNLRHLRQLVKDCTEPIVRFDFDDKRMTMVKRSMAEIDDPIILQRYGIPSAESSNLLGA